MYKDEFIQDFKALGGFPLYVVTIIGSVLLQQKPLAIELGVGLVLSFGLTVVIRMLYFRERPVKQAFKTPLEKIDSASFPSLHSMRAAVLGTLLLLHFKDLYLGIFFGALIVGVAGARVAQKRHFMRDTIAGVLIGLVIAFASLEMVQLAGLL